MLSGVEWGEYRIGDLFERVSTLKLPYKAKDLPSSPEGEFDLPCLTSSFMNQGLNYYVPKSGATILQSVISIPSNSDVYRAYYQSAPFTVLSDAYAIRWIYEGGHPSSELYLFLVSCINKVTDLPIYSYKNKLGGWNVVRKKYIQLPIRDGAIDFMFMEQFVAELKAQRVAELKAYLTVTGLSDYTLTPEEQQAIQHFQEGKLQWRDYRLTSVFEVKNAGNILSSEIVAGSGSTPYLCASRENNAVSSYVSYKDEMLSQGNCIFIGGKTFVVTYQEKDFFSNDSHNLILRLYEAEHRTKRKQLYLTTCIDKSLRHRYSWGDSISNKKIQTDKVTLPTSSNKPDYTQMETFIRAIEKLVIQDVVLYADRELAATQQVINQ